MNVALYGPGAGRWAMTERGRSALSRDAGHIAIGPSALTFDGEGLTIEVNEVTAPLPTRLTGTIRLRARGIGRKAFDLCGEGRHLWRPLAARAEVEVTFTQPDLAWRGEGYFDMNQGDAPLSTAFRDWTWQRAHLGEGSAVFYDVTRREGSRAGLSIGIGADGVVGDIPTPPWRPLPRTFWGMTRDARSDSDAELRLTRTLEDAPFYARSELAGEVLGQRAVMVHEALSLTRVTHPVVRAMLPFRMPRVFW